LSHNCREDYGEKEPVRASGSVVSRIREMEEKRNERRKKIEEERVRRREREAANNAMGYGKIDIDYQELLDQTELDPADSRNYLTTKGMRIYVCVRKRILFEKEIKDG